MSVAETMTERAPGETPETHEEGNDRQEDHEVARWIAAEDRRLGRRLLRAVRNAPDEAATIEMVVHL